MFAQNVTAHGIANWFLAPWHCSFSSFLSPGVIFHCVARLKVGKCGFKQQ
jgi:hypothetical protein